MAHDPDIKSVCSDCSPSQFSSCEAFLKAIYQRQKQSQSKYSYRRLAVDLGFPESNLLHLVIQGKRPLTEVSATKIVISLGLKKSEKQYFLAMAKVSQGSRGSDSKDSLTEVVELRSSLLKTQLEKDQYLYYSHWWHAVIREMVALESFNYDPRWISEKVWPKISSKNAAESLQLLERLQLIRFETNSQKWVQTNATVSTGSQAGNLSVTAYHLASIPHGLEALAHQPQDRRHISALTVAINNVQFEAIQKEIQDFQDKILKLEQDRSYGQPDQVVQLNMQLFPSTQQTRPSK